MGRAKGKKCGCGRKRERKKETEKERLGKALLDQKASFPPQLSLLGLFCFTHA